MSIVGKLDAFDETLEDINTYLLRLKHFIKANEIADVQKVSVLLSVLGPKLVKLLQDLLAPREIDTLSYDSLVDTLTNHFKPKKLVIIERFKFNTRSQRQGETITEYIAQIKNLAGTCKFGAFLNEALRDRLVSGLRDDYIRQRLLTEELDFEQTYERARMLEEAARNRNTFQVDTSVNKLRLQKETKKNFEKEQTNKDKQCTRCGKKGHNAFNCKYKTYKCNICQKIGHLANMCRNKKTKVSSGVRNVQEVSNNVDEIGSMYELFHIAINKVDKVEKVDTYQIDLEVNNQKIKFEIDTGTALTIIAEDTYKRYFPDIEVLPCSELNLNAYWFQQSIPLLGKIQVNVAFNGRNQILEAIIVKSGSRKLSSLMGRDWLEKLEINWQRNRQSTKFIAKDKDTQNRNILLNGLKSKYPSVFGQRRGEIKEFQANLSLKGNPIPVFCKPRSIPYAVKPLVETELQRLVKEGVLTQVMHTEWATPLVVVPKSEGQIRICADFKVTINPYLNKEHYPLPNPKDIYASLAGGKIFCALDLSEAYLQLRVSKESQHLLTVNTPFGLFRYNRLAYGVATAPAQFQAVMDQVLQNIPGVACYLDNILITGTTREECLDRLNNVLGKLERYNIKIRLDKCEFLVASVSYLGHIISESGIRPNKDLVKAIKLAPQPQNKQELKAYLGLLNYYGQFIPNLSIKLTKFYNLLNKDKEWQWSESHRELFEKTKDWICSDSILTLYDITKPLRLICDAAPQGVGAVLAHVVDGEERPVSFASKTLSAAEKNYSQLEREALAIIFGLKKFHAYLYGRQFELVTDHAPLTIIFGENKGIPMMAAARLQRWAILLSAYDYKIKYRKGTEIANADALSRLPLPEVDEMEGKCNYFSAGSYFCNFIKGCMDPVITAEEIGEATQKDDILKEIYKFVMYGWPKESSDPKLAPYFKYKNDITTDGNCLIIGNKVIIPDIFQEQILQLLHMSHQGIVKMKELARSFVWWRNLDYQIENYVKSCNACQINARITRKTWLTHWPVSNRKWERIHIDYAQFNYLNVTYNLLIIIDSYSKWLEVCIMSSTTSYRTIERLRTIFASFGLPEIIVSDNGVQFTSREFKEFLANNGIRHILIPPYHAASNGAAERAVQNVKSALQKIIQATKLNTPRPSMQRLIDNFLFTYRNTPQETTGRSPSELFLMRRPRTFLSLLKPSLAEMVEKNKQDKEEKLNIHRKPLSTFVVGDKVWVKTVRGEDEKWSPGIIIRQKGMSTFIVDVENRRRYIHKEHLRHRQTHSNIHDNVPYTNTISPNPQNEPQLTPSGNQDPTEGSTTTSEIPVPVDYGETVQVHEDQEDQELPELPQQVRPAVQSQPVEPRRSGRIRKPIIRLNYKLR